MNRKILVASIAASLFVLFGCTQLGQKPRQSASVSVSVGYAAKMILPEDIADTYQSKIDRIELVGTISGEQEEKALRTWNSQIVSGRKQSAFEVLQSDPVVEDLAADVWWSFTLSCYDDANALMCQGTILQHYVAQGSYNQLRFSLGYANGQGSLAIRINVADDVMSLIRSGATLNGKLIDLEGNTVASSERFNSDFMFQTDTNGTYTEYEIASLDCGAYIAKFTITNDAPSLTTSTYTDFVNIAPGYESTGQINN